MAIFGYFLAVLFKFEDVTMNQNRYTLRRPREQNGVRREHFSSKIIPKEEEKKKF